MESSLSSEQYRLEGVEVVAGRALGSGSHAEVVKVRYMGLTCAAKKYHFADDQEEEKDLAKRLHQHSCVLGRLRHPNLVQFIGFYCDETSLTPVLVYECLHMTLSTCIKSHGLLPDSNNYLILKDVAMALRYLHEHTTPIPHLSLTASKVLLTRDLSAKLSDVGMPGVFNPRHTKEMDKDRSERITDLDLRRDIHSYGLLMMHIITGRNLISELTVMNGTNSGSVSFCESDMVEMFLTEVHNEHILLELMEKCLNSDPHLRPSAITVLQKIAHVSAKHPPPFTDSLAMLQQIKIDAESQMRMEAKVKELTPHSSIDLTQGSELDWLKELVDKISMQNVALQAELFSRSRSSSMCSESGDIHSKSNLVRQDNLFIRSPLQIRQGYIKWTECRDMPVSMFQGQAVYLKGKIYVGGGNTGDPATDWLIFEYNPQTDFWTPLPPTYISNFGLCKLEGELITVGGILESKVISMATIFDSFTKRWKESLPSLEVPRHSPSCVSTTSAIIVCGGVSEMGGLLSSVEVMKSDTFQWYTAGYLSRSAILCHSSPAVIHNTIYMLGGYRSNTANSCTNCAHSSSIDPLLSYNGITPYTWETVPPTPHYQSTAVCTGACLLSLGGTSSAYTATVHKSIHGFSHSSNSWVYVGDLPYGFCHGMAVSLPNSQLYVMGGWVQPGRFKRSRKVYRGSIIVK